MHPAAEIAAAKITGTMKVAVGMGRRNFMGEFEPYGHAYVDANVVQKDGKWVVECPNVEIEFTHHSQRKITEVGVLIMDHWFTDPVDPTLLAPGERIAVGFVHLLPEAL